MRWTTLGTALTLALTSYFLADRWEFSAAEAIFTPACAALILVGLLVSIAVALSTAPADAAREFVETVERDFEDLVKAIRRKDK